MMADWQGVDAPDVIKWRRTIEEDLWNRVKRDMYQTTVIPAAMTQSNLTDLNRTPTWFKTKETNQMKKATELDYALLTLQAEKGIKTVDVAFGINYEEIPRIPLSDIYTYKTKVKVKKGDIVIVQSYDALKLAQVVKLHPQVDITSEYCLKWIIANVTDAKKQIDAVVEEEEQFKRNLANAKVMKEARELAAMAGVDFGKFKAIPNGFEDKSEDDPSSDQ